MQPKTNVNLDRENFNRIKKTAINMVRVSTRSNIDNAYATALPEEIGIQLTNRCNLRCKHCFEWSEAHNGYNRKCNETTLGEELPIDIIEKVLHQTEEIKSNLFLWGGEPLVYKKWEELISLLEVHKRWTVLCTNGININDKMEGILRISENLAILTSLEGFEYANDKIRGKGSYQNAITGIKTVLNLQKKGIYLGKQSVHCTINNYNLFNLFEFVEYMESLGIDTLYICFPWYITQKLARKMDLYYKNNFPLQYQDKKVNSWHSFGFHIEDKNINILLEQMKKINDRTWNIRVRYQPGIELCEAEGYARGENIVAQKKNQCLAIRDRLDILATGEVSSCKLFKEFTVGNLNVQSLVEIWRGEKYKKFRKTIDKELMPVCSRCILLYLNGK